MKEDKIIEKYSRIKDILSILLFVEFIAMHMLSSSEFNLKSVFLFLLPIGMSSLVWNEWLYNGLMYNKESLYSKSGMSYKTFIFIGLFLVFVSVISFATAVWRWW